MERPAPLRAGWTRHDAEDLREERNIRTVRSSNARIRLARPFYGRGENAHLTHTAYTGRTPHTHDAMSLGRPMRAA